MSFGKLTGTALLCVLAATPLCAQKRIELPAKDRPLALQSKTLFQVGEVEGEEYETFGNVNDVAFDAQGNLYVLDATAYRVVVFDATGKYVRTIGRQGGGPGEFGFPSAIALLPGGELVVNDAAKGSLQVFSPKGEYLRSVTLDEDLGRAVGRMRPAAGGVVTETMQMRRLMDRQQGAPATRLSLPPRSVSWLDIGEKVTGRRLYNAAPREAKMSSPQTSNGGAMRISMSISAFEPSLLWTPLPSGGVAALNTADYRIAFTDASGRPLQYIERPIEPRKVTDADKKRFLEARKKGMGPGGSGTVIAFASGGAGGGSGARPPSGAMRMEAPTDLKESDVNWGELIPVLSALGTDSYGRLWVQRTSDEQGKGPIDLIDSSLRYIGTLTAQDMPRAFGPDGRVAYITRDDLDVQRIVVKQVAR